MASLAALSLYRNRIASLGELQYLKPLRMLRELDLRLNPVAMQPDYRLAAIHALPQLEVLDTLPVTAAESGGRRLLRR